LGEGESEERQKQRRDDAEETNDVSRSSPEDRGGATRSVGEREGSKEDGLKLRRKHHAQTPA
jgi:hypothetical protein